MNIMNNFSGVLAALLSFFLSCKDRPGIVDRTHYESKRVDWLSRGALISWVAVLILGCRDFSGVNSNPDFSAPPSNSQETQMINPVRPKESVDFIPGAPIKPSAQLLDWLNNETEANDGSMKLFRLPVVVYFEDSYRLALGDSFIGTSDADRNDDAIFLSLDDSSMGTSLLSTLSDICPKTETSCAVWIEGYWGSLLDLDLSELGLAQEDNDESSEWPFSILEVHGLVTEEELNNNESVSVFIESPSE